VVTVQTQRHAVVLNVYSTLKSDCPVFVRLAAVEVAGKAVLRVTKVELVHNHEVSKVLNDMLPQNRRLNQQQQDAVQSLVCLPYWQSPLAIFDNAVSVNS